jgi:peptidoglycan-associated lipoprotein
MRRTLAVVFLLSACSHKDQVQDTTPKAPTAPVAAQTPPAETTTAQATPAPTHSDSRPTTDPIYFEFNEALISAAGQGELRSLGDWMSSHPSATVLISGHADERGTVEYNLALGTQRAEAALEYLERLGVPKTRIKTISYGKQRPAVDGHDEASWAKNRRDELELQNSGQAER